MEITTLRKRDGRTVPFDATKIAIAIGKAFIATQGAQDQMLCLRLAQEVCSMLELEGSEVPDVEHIQDLVEQVLMKAGCSQQAKAYILYREERSRARQMNWRLMQKFEEITFKDAADSDIKRENANIDGDTSMGSMLRYGSEGAKLYCQMFLMNPDHARAHDNGDIHIHDMDFYALTTTCCQIDLKQLFAGGFSTGLGGLREPQSIQSYAALACIAIQSNQNDQHGGQSITNFDYAMADGVRKSYRSLYRKQLANALELLGAQADPEALFAALAAEGLYPQLEESEAYAAREQALLSQAGVAADTIARARSFAASHARRDVERATYQAMESLIHNLNTMESRSGSQTPFSSINYGMDTSPEARLAIRSLLLATEAGLGNGETPIFPIQIFRCKAGVSFNPGDPDLPLQSRRQLQPGRSQLRSVPAGMPLLRQAPVPEFLLPGRPL